MVPIFYTRLFIAKHNDPIQYFTFKHNYWKCIVSRWLHLNTEVYLAKTNLTRIPKKYTESIIWMPHLLQGVLHLHDPIPSRVHGPSCSFVALLGRPQILPTRNLNSNHTKCVTDLDYNGCRWLFSNHFWNECHFFYAAGAVGKISSNLKPYLTKLSLSKSLIRTVS